MEKEEFNKIYLYDTSALLIAGQYNKTFKTFETDCIPTGGLFKLLQYLRMDLDAIESDIRRGLKSTIVMCIDPKHNLRKELYPDYKSNREARRAEGKSIDNHLVSLQFQYFNEFFRDLGINAIEIDGLEADDIIYNIAWQNRKSEIILRADDSDLKSTSVVNPNVTIESPSGKRSYRMTRPEFNLSTKILKGDQSDCIKHLHLDRNLEEQLCSAMNTGIIPIYTENITKESLIDMLGNSEIIEKLYKNIFLVQPKILFSEIKINEIELNYEKLYETLSVFRMRKFCKSFLKKDIDINSKTVIEKHTKLRYLLPTEVVDYYNSLKYTHTKNQYSDEVKWK